MISRLRGNLESKKPPFLLVDVNGVGYEVQVPMSTIYQLPECGNVITLLTHHHVREDAHILYGFYEERERALFRALIKISGVGPKLALTILSGMDTTAFLFCVEHRDIDTLVRLPGVGKKTAERLLVEMAGKLKAPYASDDGFSARLLEKPRKEANFKFAYEEAIAALIALGYKPQEATRAVSVVEEDGLVTQELIRRALQGMAKQ